MPTLYNLIRDYRAALYFFESLINRKIPDEIMPLWIVILTIIIYAVLILRPISAYGLFRLKLWGKHLTIGTLIIDIMVRLIGFIHIWTYYDRNPEAKRMYEEMEKQIASGQIENVQYVSMIPSYVMAVIGIISIVALFKINLRELQKGSA